ncbi:response regulator transcription factor [Pseudogemmobacter bohemicus]|uniref:response regulator transcription factor n=1 Tax=Pseudogemmobacter bohemicus TaxID=2250708 RepID=UPI000DD407D6|nr:response regulator transcription factor [Pseudogemmobacter bohemicus]
MQQTSQQAPLVLIVDDDSEIRTLLARYLTGQAFRVQTAASRREAEARLSEARQAGPLPDLVVLDVMLPDGSGLDICRDLRARFPSLAIIMLTALKEDIDRIIGLEIGADDYLGKPFNPRELVARIRSVLRRAAPEPSTPAGAGPRHRYQMAGFAIDVEMRRVEAPDGEEISLTGAEFDLLRVFLERPGRLLSRDQLLDLTQGRDRDPFDRSIDVLMSRLRRKLGDKTGEAVFRTVRNGGYQLVLPVEAQGEARGGAPVPSLQPGGQT